METYIRHEFICVAHGPETQDGGKARSFNLEPLLSETLFFRAVSYNGESDHGDLTAIGLAEGQRVKITIERIN